MIHTTSYDIVIVIVISRNTCTNGNIWKIALYGSYVDEIGGPACRGIIHLVSSDGLSDWQVVELTVESVGASRPHACLNEPENSVYLFFEQADGSSKSSKVKAQSMRMYILGPSSYRLGDR